MMDGPNRGKRSKPRLEHFMHADTTVLVFNKAEVMNRPTVFTDTEMVADMSPTINIERFESGLGRG